MSDQWTISNYQVTGDPDLADFDQGMTPELERLIPDLYEEVIEGKETSILKMNRLIEENPRTPQLKNFLSILYIHCGMEEKAHEVNVMMVKNHPDYVFGRLAVAASYFNQGEYEKMPEVLGKGMGLKQLYPNRKVFFIGEVLEFNKIAVFYFSAAGDLEQAEIRLDIMEEIDDEANETEIARDTIMNAQLNDLSFLLDEDEDEEPGITVETAPVQQTRVTKAPQLNHAESQWLYEEGFEIDSQKIATILALPRQTLIADLETMLLDMNRRYTHFVRQVDELEEEQFYFPIHALMLLGDLRAEESLDQILDALRSPSEVIDFWLSEVLTDMIWDVVHKIGSNKLNQLRDFLLEPGVYTFSKTEVSRAMRSVAQFQPERRDEVLACYRQILSGFNAADLQDNLLDSQFLGLFIADLMDLQATELLDDIKPLYDKGYVAEEGTGPFETLTSEMERGPGIPEGLSKSVVDWYRWVVDEHDDDDLDPYRDSLDEYQPSMTVVKSPKVGRNEPCPCGSGKKYKKCCLGTS